ncbi:MAG TPA: hypothetical protein VEK79_07440 [Thermoanaerobaculia bacterium]|nr:hypothetical protein [Thermoanaerobaculia bacterium]
MRARIAIVAAAVVFALSVHAQDVEVRLEETGIADWNFLSPKLPVAIGTDQSIVFLNETGSRTFIVTIPFEFRTGEFETAYSVASVDGTFPQQTVSAFVRRVLPALPSASGEVLDNLEYLRVLREDVNATKADNAAFADLTATSGLPARTTFTAGHFEALYWSAACGLDQTALARLGDEEDDPLKLREALNEKAKAFIGRLLGGDPLPPARCDAEDLRKQVLTALVGGHTINPTPATTYERSKNAVLNRFLASRTLLAKNTLLAAIDARVKATYENEAKPVLQMLENRRTKESGTNKNFRNCELRFLRTAASLIASYGPDAKVPFNSPLLKQDPSICSAFTDARPLSTDAAAMNTYNVRLEEAEEYADPIGDVADVGFDITDCTGDTKTTCSARAAIPPRQRAVFPRAILERRSDRVIQFTVSFFDEAEPPANATGYVRLSTRPRIELKDDEPDETIANVVPAKLLFNFGGDAGADYALPKNAVDSHVRRTTGASSLGFQYIGAFDLSATLQFKKGEFGGGATSNQVQASQYQAKVFGPIGSVLEYGRFVFAKPSSGIAMSETGEGLRFSMKRGSLGYLVRRESDNPATPGADEHDRDSYVLIGQVNAGFGWLRSLLLTASWGNEKGITPPTTNANCEQAKTPPCIVPHTYSTFGFDAKFPLASNVVMNAAAYHSVRNVREDSRLDDDPPLNLDPRANGKGDVALLTVSWSRLVEQSLLNPLAQAKPSFSLTGLLGYGSSDDPSTPNRDEGFLGETAGYANDKLFLSALAETKKQLGHGLANKWYGGFQYSNARFSPLFWVARLLKAQKEVQSMATTVTLHKYQFIRDLHCGDVTDKSVCDADLARGHKDGGYEADVEFLIETPKSVRWTLSGAWYRRSKAVEAVGIKRNPWVVAANVSIKISK